MPIALPVADHVARAIHGFVGDLKKAFGPRLHRVILYGSAARGTMGEDSDIDVLVVVDRASREGWP